VKGNILYKGDDLRLTIYECYSWEMASICHIITCRSGKEYGESRQTSRLNINGRYSSNPNTITQTVCISQLHFLTCFTLVKLSL
jgi:hypothetical protein